MAETETAVPIFKKKSRGANRQVQVRKRSASPTRAESESDSTEHQHQRDPNPSIASSSVVQKKKRVERNPLRQGTVRSSSSKRFKLDRDDEGDEDEGAEGMAGDRFGEIGISSYSKSTGATKAANTGKEDATKVTDWDLEVQDGSIISKKGKEKQAEDQKNDDGIYRGSKSYSNFQTQPEKKSDKHKTKGPMKASAHIREITLVDYQPDVCKDYKETGYCGFGDTCKFLHDRSDYLAGWQLNGSTSNSNKRSKGIMESDEEDEEDEDEEDIPFACLICRQPFTNPVVTKCGHYFCESCAIKRFTKNPKCFACGEQTSGIFNSATKILEKMEKKRLDKEEERLEKRRFRGDFDGPEEEGGEELIEGVEIEGRSGSGGEDEDEE